VSDAAEPGRAERPKARRRVAESAPTSTRGRELRAPEPLTDEEERKLHREWWLRLPLTIIAPRAVFTALRDESEASRSARQEPVLLLVLLSGIAAVMQTSAAGSLLDNPELDGALVFVWAVIGGVMYGAVTYWFGGFAIYLGSRGATAKKQAKPTYLRARHVVAFAAAPIALSLIVWPFRLAIFGTETFQSRGGESTGEQIFSIIGTLFVVWALGLLIYGIRTTYAWTWIRAIGTMLLGVLALLCITAPFVFV
jgi:quinol-cytochrome oxidoreductase complex cytochrome b subunit